MFDPFTDRVRKAMRLAYQEAARFRSDNLLPKHIFLGLVLEGAGVQAHALKNLGVDLNKLRIGIEKTLEPGYAADKVMTGSLPFSTPAKRVIECSIAEARKLRHNYVGCEHLLLGLLDVNQDEINNIVANFGLTRDRVREEICRLLREPGKSDGAPQDR